MHSETAYHSISSTSNNTTEENDADFKSFQESNRSMHEGINNMTFIPQ
jgi:hypothetical protein